MVMRSYSLPEAYAAHGPTTRVRGVRALLALAPRSGTQSWSGRELRQWVELTDRVADDEIESALTLATAWGAGESQQVAVAAHVLLVRFAPRDTDEDALRLRGNVESVCAHLRSRMGRDLAKRLPRPESARSDLPSAAVWAYFFACLATLLFAIVITR